MTFQEHLEKIKELDKALTADDDRFRSVLVEHHDGILLQHNAFCEQRDANGDLSMKGGEYLYVFGEHMKAQIFHLDEVKRFANFELNYGGFISGDAEA